MNTVLLNFMVGTAGVATGFWYTVWLRGTLHGHMPFLSGLTFLTLALNIQAGFAAVQHGWPPPPLLVVLWLGNAAIVRLVGGGRPAANPPSLVAATTPPDPAIAAEVTRHMRKKTCNGVDALRLHLVSEHGDTADLLAADRVVVLAHGFKYPDCTTPGGWNETRVRTQLALLTAYLDRVTTADRSPE